MPSCGNCGKEFDSERAVKGHQSSPKTDCTTDDGIDHPATDDTPSETPDQDGDTPEPDSSGTSDGSGSSSSESTSGDGTESESPDTTEDAPSMDLTPNQDADASLELGSEPPEEYTPEMIGDQEDGEEDPAAEEDLDVEATPDAGEGADLGPGQAEVQRVPELTTQHAKHLQKTIRRVLSAVGGRFFGIPVPSIEEQKRNLSRFDPASWYQDTAEALNDLLPDHVLQKAGPGISLMTVVAPHVEAVGIGVQLKKQPDQATEEAPDQQEGARQQVPEQQEEEYQEGEGL